jgi:hypothetical protein
MQSTCIVAEKSQEMVLKGGYNGVGTFEWFLV